jgi:hypothetical protein
MERRVGLEGQTMILTTLSTLQNEIPQSLGAHQKVRFKIDPCKLIIKILMSA